MYVVIVSSWLRKIEPVVVQLPGVYTIKKVGPRLFLFVDQDESFGKVKGWIKKYIIHYLTSVYVFEIYGMFANKVDIIDYLPPEMKRENKYYNTKGRDLTDEEIDTFFKSHPELKKAAMPK